jgi:Uncharacterised nucleotidyltransferase
VRHLSFPIDLEGPWRRLDRISIGGRDVCTLSPEDLLLILCVQGYKDAWERLKHICDVAEVILVHQDMDWGRVIGRTTILIITHRLSTVRGADVIHVLEAGRLVESGDWDALLSKEGRYASLARAQDIG